MYRKKQYIQGSVLAAFSGVHWGPWDIYSKTRWGGGYCVALPLHLEARRKEEGRLAWNSLPTCPLLPLQKKRGISRCQLCLPSSSLSPGDPGWDPRPLPSLLRSSAYRSFCGLRRPLEGLCPGPARPAWAPAGPLRPPALLFHCSLLSPRQAFWGES